MTLAQNTKSDELVNDIQNLMLMSKLSEGVVVYLDEKKDLENCFIILRGAPLAYRHFVIIMSALLRGAGSSVYDEALWEQIYDVWQAFGYQYISYKAKHHTTFTRNLLREVAQYYKPMDETGKVDYRPMMAEVYLKLTEN